MKVVIPVEVELVDLPDGRRRANVTVPVRENHAGVTPVFPFGTDGDGRPAFEGGSVLLDLLQAAVRGEVGVGTIFTGTDSPERIVESLLDMEDRRPGLAYEVGMLLLEKNPSKEFPGPDPYDFTTAAPVGEIRLVACEKTTSAVHGLKGIWKLAFNPAMKRAMDLNDGTPTSRSSTEPGAPQTLAEAEAEVAQWATYGVRAEIVGYGGDQPVGTHRRHMRDCMRGPIG